VISAIDLTYIVEVSNDLNTWNSGAGYTTTLSVTTNPGNATQTVVVQSLSPINSSNPHTFMRLKVIGR